MNQKFLFPLWGCLFILCAACGFIPDPEGPLRLVLTAVSLVFFLPPALLLYGAQKKKDTDTPKLIRNLSFLSLGLTALLLIGNFFTVFSSEFFGQVFHYTLVMVSSPMVCSGNWALSLFLWACLLMVSLKQLKR